MSSNPLEPTSTTSPVDEPGEPLETSTSNHIPPPPTTEPSVKATETTHVELTFDFLSPTAALSHIRSPSAGALVLFAGTTRNTFNAQPVASLAYEAYVPLALNTLHDIATSVHAKHGLVKVFIIHRLGNVPVGEESILIAVSAAHRAEAWRAGEEALEETKRRAEIWKLERFVGGEGVWRANRDGVMGVREDEGEAETGG